MKLSGSYDIDTLYTHLSSPQHKQTHMHTVLLVVLVLTLIGILEKGDRHSVLWDMFFQYGSKDLTNMRDYQAFTISPDELLLLLLVCEISKKFSFVLKSSGRWYTV